MSDELPALGYDFYASVLSPQRKHKFRRFIASLRSVKYLPRMRERGAYLEQMWLYHRNVDDIVDGDAPLPPQYASRTQYVDARLQHLADETPVEPIDKLARLMRTQAARFGQDFTHENETILGTMRFDAERRDEFLAQPAAGRVPRAYPAAVLEKHFVELDIEGCVKSMLKIYDEPIEHYAAIAPLARAVREYYTVRDYPGEVRNGLLNMTRDNVEHCGLPLERLADGTPEYAYTLLTMSVAHGREHLRDYRERCKPKLQSLKPLTKATLYWTFERPTAEFFTAFHTWPWKEFKKRFR